MSPPASKAWIVAASIGAVEALKDQGICRWNYTIRLLQQHAKSNIRSFTIHQDHGLFFLLVLLRHQQAAAAVSNEMRKANMKRKKSLEKSMNLSCWGPSTTRF
uniref:Wound-responsive family protein n=1 Tax=Salix viminalis TaxID=40686 RepID=A0A6N2MHY0_SALVM